MMYDDSTNQVSAFDAKTQLSQLPVIPDQQPIDTDIHDVIEAMRLASKGITLGKGNSIQKFKEKGRR